ncbi:hypothetical protein BCR35DRAFT_310717, partial [Leucosporidium creatinivorum]
MSSPPPTPPPLPRRPGSAVLDSPAATPPPLPARPTPPPAPAATPSLASFSSSGSTSTSSTVTAAPPPSRPVPPTPILLPPRPPSPNPEAEAPAAPRLDPLAQDDGDFSSDSDSDSDSEKEDAYETLASRIAAAHPMSDDTSTLNSFDSGKTSRSARLKGLRRRVLGGFRKDEAIHKKYDDASSYVESVAEEDEEAALRRALNELEDVKVARFLERVGHRVQEVSIAPPSGPVVFPETSSFTYNGRTDWYGFGTAWLSTVAAAYCPHALLAAPPRNKLSLSFLMDELERVYVLAPPTLAEQVIEGELARIWRWESPQTWKWCAIYASLWITDLIPALPILILLYLIVNARLFPPTPAELLAEGKEQVARSKEAAELSKQLKSSSRVGLVLGSAARGVVSSFRDNDRSSEQGSALARGLGESAMLGGLAGGLRIDSEVMQRARKKEVPPSAMARALMGASSGAGGIGGGDRMRYEPPQTPPPTASATSPPATPPVTQLKHHPDGGISLYRLVTELGRVLGPSAQQMLADGADIGEKIKNILTHPEHPSVTPILLRLVGLFVILLVIPTWIQIKFAWAYLGFEFFFLWRLRELLPQYRKALTPIWWLLLGAPTDAEFATFVLQKRSQEKRPLRGRKTIKRMAKAQARASSDVSQLNGPYLGSNGGLAPSRSSLSVNRSSLDLNRTLTSDSTRDGPAFEPEEPIGVFFALFTGIPGDLIITPSRIRFSSTRGFRTLSLVSGKLAKKLASRSSADLSDSESVKSVKVAETGYAVDLGVEQVVGVKKESRFRFEGLLITTKSGEVFRLANVSDRDDAFNKLLSVTPTSFQVSR